jgi:heme-degrading monooxygenase HmoA
MFEVNRKPDHMDEYLELAKQLKPILERIDGFVDNERFESQLRKGWLLSHSTWRDEKSVIRWRTEGEHHGVQEKGRFKIFQDYHLRVGEVVTDTVPTPKAPVHELRFDETAAGVGTYASFTEVIPQEQAAFAAQPDLLTGHLGLDSRSEGLLGHDTFKTIADTGKLAILCTWKNEKAANSWLPKPLEGVKELRHRIVRVVRDYGMYDRREAPQYYADVAGAETKHAKKVEGPTP